MSKLSFRTVIISDTHLGKGAASAEFLFEFLQHIQCEKLILAGDIIEGWGLKEKKRKAFPEMHARCFDAINAHAANGTEIIYLRGNHDEDLAKSRYKLMKRTINFSERKGETISPIMFAKSHVHVDAKGKRHLVLHGDVFDAFQKEKGKKKIAKIADIAYENLVSLNHVFRKAALGITGHNISPASHLKNATKKMVGVIENFEAGVAKESIRSRYDGVVCGHIHHAEIREIDGCSYMNSGDWVESCRCLVEDENGEWKILDWSETRAQLGLRKPPTIMDANPFADFRPITERQLALVRRVWPGKDYAELIADRRECREKLIKREEDILSVFGEVSAKELKHYRKKVEKQEQRIAEISSRLQPHPRAA